MIKNIITFKLSEQIFAVDMQSVPLILKAKDFLPKNFFFENDFNAFKYGTTEVQLLNLYELLDIVPKEIEAESRILVGEENGYSYGIVVDQVIEIINLNGSSKHIYSSAFGKGIPFCNNVLEIEGTEYLLIDIQEILKTVNLKNNKTIIHE